MADFPEELEVGEHRIAVNTDFRAALGSLLAFEDPELTPQERQQIVFRNLCLDLPADISRDELGSLQERVNWFLNGGKETKDDEDSGPRVFSFNKDATLIFAAFRQTHGIDLQSADLHWWGFLALFMDLGSETSFYQLIALRKRVKTGKASKEERNLAHEMGDLFDLPEIDDRSAEERDQDDEFLALVEKGKQRRAKAQL